MRKIDRRIVIVAALIFIVGLAYGLMKFLIAMKEEPPISPPMELKRHVKTNLVGYDTVVSPVNGMGRLASLNEIDLVAEASGKIYTYGVPLKKGATFSKGAVLFTIYPDEAVLALQARKSQFLTILANLLPDLAIDFPDHVWRFTDFFDAINLDEPLPDFPEVKDEKLKIFLAGRNVLSEYYHIKKDELQLKRHTRVAPFNGTYDQVFLEAGAYTNTGGRVAHIIRTDLMELEVPLDRFDAEWVRIGDRVKVRSDKRDLSWQGTVVRKNKFVDPDTQSQGIFVRLKNKRGVPLLAGEYLTAIFPGHPVPGVMEIPRNAVFNTNEVFVVRNRRLQKKLINVVKVNEKTLIFNGLPQGDTLVVQPLINVQEGTLVETGLQNRSNGGIDQDGIKAGDPLKP